MDGPALCGVNRNRVVAASSVPDRRTPRDRWRFPVAGGVLAPVSHSIEGANDDVVPARARDGLPAPPVGPGRFADCPQRGDPLFMMKMV